MYKSLYLILCALFAAGSAAAQHLPERSEVRKGNRQYHKGNYEEAIRRYEHALELAPGQFEATYDLGNALYKAGQYERAEQTLQQAAADTLRTADERAEAFYNLGNARFRQKKYKEALESYRQSLRLNPADMEAKYNYAYTKRLLDEQNNGGGGNDDRQQEQQQQNQDQNQSQNGQQDQNQQDRQDQQGQDRQDRQGDDGNPADEQPSDEREGQQPVPAGISEQEQQQMLDAIQAQEDKTQEKLKEKQGVIVRGKKNW